MNQTIKLSASHLKLSYSLYLEYSIPNATSPEAQAHRNKHCMAFKNKQALHYYNTNHVSKDTSGKWCRYQEINNKFFIRKLLIDRSSILQ
ncbi:hypothetical protein V8G56_12315 [Gaetbulibacter aquiaggeris]|uniref:Uncharacterized protein n=1 Tax=Gaetbulibacter aquiaggeris TaxID=1735373 RepID=A0ABW7MRQ0_9FLAO